MVWWGESRGVQPPIRYIFVGFNGRTGLGFPVQKWGMIYLQYISVLLCIIATWMKNMMTHQSNMMVFSRKPEPWWWVKSKNHITTKMRWINGANQTNPVFFPTNSVFIVLFQTFDLRVLGRLPICWSIHRLKLHIVGWKLPAIFFRFRKYHHSDPLPTIGYAAKKHKSSAILDAKNTC